MEVLGKIKVIGETLQVTDSYKKRELVVTTDEQYPQHISVEFGQDKVSLLDNRVIGENVKVSINLAGREWTNPQGETKYFNSIKGWRIEKLDGQSAPATHKAEVHTAVPMAQAPVVNDDLPF